MKLSMPLTAARNLSIVAVSMRLFAGLMIDSPRLLNSGWISALAGAILCLPILWLGEIFMRAHPARPIADSLAETAGLPATRALAAILWAVLLHDAAAMVRLNSNSASYIALASAPTLLHIVPLLAVVLAVAWKNGQTAGAAAILWMRLFPILFGIALLLQLEGMHTRWLTPIFGPGLRQLGKGTLSAAGWIAPIAAAWLAAEPNKRDLQQKIPLLRSVLYIGVLVSLFLAVQGMMAPADLFGNPTRAFQFDKLLSNGRVSLSLQLPMVLMWFNGSLFALLFDLFLSAKMLQIILPRLDGRILLSVCAILTALIALLGKAEQYAAAWIGNWLYLIISVPFLLVMLIAWIRKGRKAA